MANVNEQENNEPRPNLYNQRKSWHTSDVMPTDNPVTADSLFVEPTQITQDESNVNREVPQEATEEKSSGNYKKDMMILKNIMIQDYLNLNRENKN